MLAQSFMSAADLGITEPQRDALQKVLVLLETGKLVHVPKGDLCSPPGKEFTGHFNMGFVNNVTDCGTVCCIWGTAELISGVNFRSPPIALHSLFYAGESSFALDDITPAQAARALRSYLTTGDARWAEALAG